MYKYTKSTIQSYSQSTVSRAWVYWEKHAYLSNNIVPSVNRSRNFSPIKCSASLPSACKREAKSRSEQCSFRHSFSAVIVKCLPCALFLTNWSRPRYISKCSLNGSYCSQNTKCDILLIKRSKQLQFEI